MIKCTFVRNILAMSITENSRLSCKTAKSPVWTRQIVFELRQTTTSLFSERLNEQPELMGIKG